MANVYYDPEEFGLVGVDNIDYSSGSYEFDTRVVWFHEATGVFYTARDSGCSCPSPFEGYIGLDDLDVLTDTSDLRAEIREAQEGRYSSLSHQEAQDFLTKVQDALDEVRGA